MAALRLHEKETTAEFVAPDGSHLHRQTGGTTQPAAHSLTTLSIPHSGWPRPSGMLPGPRGWQCCECRQRPTLRCSTPSDYARLPGQTSWAGHAAGSEACLAMTAQ
jgi:hypothetical protein